MPEAVFEQLRGGGILVAPVGPGDGIQELKRYLRTPAGIEETKLADVRFVPLIPGVAERL